MDKSNFLGSGWRDFFVALKQECHVFFFFKPYSPFVLFHLSQISADSQQPSALSSSPSPDYWFIPPVCNCCFSINRLTLLSQALFCVQFMPSLCLCSRWSGHGLILLFWLRCWPGSDLCLSLDYPWHCLTACFPHLPPTCYLTVWVRFVPSLFSWELCLISVLIDSL